MDEDEDDTATTIVMSDTDEDDVHALELSDSDGEDLQTLYMSWNAWCTYFCRIAGRQSGWT